MKINPIKQKLYKVVRERDGQLVSYLKRLTNTRYSLVYKPGEITRPIGKSKIFTFSDSTKARSWAMESHDLQVWEAEGYGAKKAGIMYFSQNASEDRLNRFWGGFHDCFVDSVPTETVYCESVKLIKKIA